MASEDYMTELRAAFTNMKVAETDWRSLKENWAKVAETGASPIVTNDDAKKLKIYRDAEDKWLEIARNPR